MNANQTIENAIKLIQRVREPLPLGDLERELYETCKDLRQLLIIPKDSTWDNMSKEQVVLLLRLAMNTEHRKTGELNAALNLCYIYFSIASQAIGETATRATRDRMIREGDIIPATDSKAILDKLGLEIL